MIDKFIANINSFPLKNWDEAWYAEITKNMVERGTGLLVPFWNGQYYFDKPPLYFWLSAPFYALFGAGEWQARIVSVISGLGASFLVYLLGTKLFGRKAGVLSCLVFFTLGQVVSRFQEGNLDALLVFLSLSSFYIYLRSTTHLALAALSGIFAGLAVLTKGWMLGLFPIFLIVVYAIFVERRITKREFIVILVAILSSAWWFVLGWWKFGQPFLSWYLFAPAAGNLISPVASFSLTLVKDVIRDVGFWVVPVLLVIGHKHISYSYKKLLLPFIVVIVMFVVPVSFLKEKFGWYLLPVYPLVALILGSIIQNLSLFSRMWILAIVIVLVFQILHITNISSTHPDKSKISAQLGKLAKELVPRDDTIILDDPDFPSFLYYSQHRKVYVVSGQGGKPGEWWIKRYSDLPHLARVGHTWIVSRSLSNLPLKFSEEQILGEYLGYKFLRLRGENVI